MSKQEKPSSGIQGVENSSRNIEIINLLMTNTSGYVFNDTEQGVANIAERVQKQRMLNLRIANLWSNPLSAVIMSDLGFEASQAMLHSADFDMSNRRPPSLVVAGLDEFLLQNEKKLEHGSEADRILQMIKIAEKYSASAVITFKGDNYEAIARLADPNMWSRNLLLDFTGPATVR